MLLISLLIYIGLYQIIHNFYINQTTNNLTKETILLKELINRELYKNSDPLNKIIKKIDEKLDTRITVIDLSGIVLADSRKEFTKMENHKHRPEIVKALQTGFGTATRYSKTLKQYMLYVAMSIGQNTNTIGIIRTSIPLKDINTIIFLYRRQLIFFLMIVILIGFIISLFLSKKFVSPIIRLSNASKMIAKGNFDFPLLPTKHRSKEIKILETNFENMKEQLKTMFVEIQREKEEFKSVISSVSEIIIILDKNGKILSTNNSFNEFFRTTQTIGKYYWEVFRMPKIAKYIDKAKEKRKHITREVELNDKVFLCSINYIKANMGYIIILNDLTEIRQLSEIKKDIITNVSHELNTPLTTINGYVETILDEKLPNHIKDYLVIVQKNVDRLKRLTTDLLKLSEVDREDYQLDLQKINLNDLITEIIPNFDNFLKKKNLKIKLKPQKAPLYIDGDYSKLEEVFINLIDNAIKYSNGGGTIKIITENTMQGVIVRISDNGIGIPHKDLDRIFERFYVVDKSRSKKNGGTGLGLSIVRHILLMHNATISVTSEENKGTTFIILFPIFFIK